MNEHIWNYVVNKKVLNKPEYVLYFRFFKVATFSFDSFFFDSFAHSWHSLNQLGVCVCVSGKGNCEHRPAFSSLEYVGENQ